MNWLSALIEKLFAFIPRLLIVEPDEAGVRTTLGSHIKALTPGWYFYWPLIQREYVIGVTAQVVDLRAQSLTTLDDKSIAISGAIEYGVRDIEKASFNIQDFDRSLPILCLGKIAEYVESHNLRDCRSVAIKGVLRKEIREHVSMWGISVKHIFITDNVPAKTYRIMLNNVGRCV